MPKGPFNAKAGAGKWDLGVRKGLRGNIVRVLPSSGFGVIQQTDSQKQFAFSFDQIENYHGQSVGELRLRTGAPVEFYIAGDFLKGLKII